MGELFKVEIELGEEANESLAAEAERLGTTPGDIAQRAVALWLNETDEERVKKRG